MTNLKDLLPKESEIVKAIYTHYKKCGDAKPIRSYLGASSIGHYCERYLWYQFRYCCKPAFSGRIYRLFNTGEREEPRFINDLCSIKATVHATDADGSQFAVSALGGHFSGHLDGCAIGVLEAPKTWHVLEFKTHNAKSFVKLKKDGTENSKPQHYAQCQIYMHLTGMTRTLYLACNKDTDDLYSERIYYNKERAEFLLSRAKRIITTAAPPERPFPRSNFYQCKWCDARAICWGIQEEGKYQALPVPAISCRQCCHATPRMDGNARWECEKHERSLSEVDQARACDDHLCLPGLFAFVDTINYGTDSDGKEYIEFEDKDKNRWKHGKEANCFSTKELMRLSQQQLHIGMITDTKNLYQAEVTGVCQDDILHRYPTEDSEIVWQGRASKVAEAWKENFAEDLESLKPITICDAFEYMAAEYEESRVVIVWPNTKEAEIRKGKE